jgi:hypothetical protein
MVEYTGLTKNGIKIQMTLVFNSNKNPFASLILLRLKRRPIQIKSSTVISSLNNSSVL